MLFRSTRFSSTPRQASSYSWGQVAPLPGAQQSVTGHRAREPSSQPLLGSWPADVESQRRIAASNRITYGTPSYRTITTTPAPRPYRRDDDSGCGPCVSLHAVRLSSALTFTQIHPGQGSGDYPIVLGVLLRVADVWLFGLVQRCTGRDWAIGVLIYISRAYIISSSH